jgi:hypothetical protein
MDPLMSSSGPSDHPGRVVPDPYAISAVTGMFSNSCRMISAASIPSQFLFGAGLERWDMVIFEDSGA